VAELLAPLGFTCTPHDADTLHVAVPSHRGDVSHTADLCEEVARMYGYDNLPSTIMADELPVQRTNLVLEREHFSRDILTGAGLNEAITYSLTSREAAAKLDPAELEATNYLRLANPLSPEREFMRRSILPTLLEAAGNRRMLKVVGDSHILTRIFQADRHSFRLDILETTLGEHESIARAVNSRDGAAAADAMSRHIRNSLDLTLAEADNDPAKRWWAE
jgi:phenylalanyl-tRNA synthetase beta subunit